VGAQFNRHSVGHRGQFHLDEGGRGFGFGALLTPTAKGGVSQMVSARKGRGG
jgi:hypothetical protein